MKDENIEMRPVIKLELASMDDLVRMAFFSAIRNSGLNFLTFTENDTNYIGFITGVAGYFELRGVPMFFYVKGEKLDEKSKFIKYLKLN